MQLPQDLVKDIIEAFETSKKKTYAHVSRKLNLPKELVKTVLNDAGIKSTGMGITDEQKQEIIKLYQEHVPVRHIDERTGISYKTVYQVIKEAGIYRPGARKTISEEQEELIQELYSKGYSSREVAERVGVSKDTVLRYIENPRASKVVATPHNGYYFSSIDTNEKAYWLGMMFADGNVSSTDNSITLSLADEDVIEDFRNAIEAHTKKIAVTNRKTKGHKNLYTLRIFSKQLHSDLIEWGCIPNKTAQLEELPNIEDKYMSHFIRGYFDGNGSIWFSTNRPHTSISGHRPFLANIQKIMVEQIGLNFTKITTRKKNSGDIRYGGFANVEKIYNYLYKDATVYMSRKKTKFEQILFN
jgi:transposase-like protein/DNA-binding transcriptional regulator WhiA